jgi:hypothetical protein
MISNFTAVTLLLSVWVSLAGVVYLNENGF